MKAIRCVYRVKSDGTHDWSNPVRENVDVISIVRSGYDEISVSWIGESDNKFHCQAISSYMLDMEFIPIKTKSQESPLSKLKKWARQQGSKVDSDRLIELIERLENE